MLLKKKTVFLGHKRICILIILIGSADLVQTIVIAFANDLIESNPLFQNEVINSLKNGK